MIPSPDIPLRFRALGPPDLRGPAGTDPAVVLARPKLLALVAFLASTPGGFQRRDTLVGLFWSELDQERARSALRQSLYYLRQFLGDGVVITRGDDDVGLSPDRFQSDLAAFEAALRAGDAAAALDAYRGPLLEGLFLPDAPEFERWLENRREALRRQARAAAWELAERAAAEGNAGSAAHWGQRAVDLDPLDEGVLQAAIQLFDRLGDRTGAVRLYESFARRLAEDLDVLPSPETQALIAAVRSRSRLVGAPDAPAAPPSPPTGVFSPPRAGTDEGPDRPRARAALTRAEIRIGIAVGAIVVAGLVLLQAFHGGRTATPALDARRVLVAGFENQTGDSTLDPLGRMATDWITQGLDALTVIDVVSSAWGLPPGADYDGDRALRPEEPKALARVAGAGTVVTGSYYRNGDSIGFQTQIVDARTGRLLLAVPPATGSAASPGALVDTLRGLVLSTMAAVFDTIPRPTAGRRPPSYEAYQAFLAGHRAYQRRPMDMREALTFFERAVQLDSAFLEPRFYMAWAHMNLGEWDAALTQAGFLEARRPRLSPTQNRVVDWQLALLRGDHAAVLEAARAVGDSADIGVAAMRVNRLREAIRSLSSVRTLHARYYRWLDLIHAYHMLGDHASELREARQARSEYPTGLGMLEAELAAHAALGQLDEVQRLLDESMALPPEDGRLPISAAFTAAAELRAHGHREAALAAADRAIAWYEALPPPRAAAPRLRFDRGVAYYLRERWDDARAVFETLLTEDPDQIDPHGFLGVLAARRGDTATAHRFSDALTGTSPLGNLGRDLYWQACIAAQLHEPARAMTLLQEAFGRGQPFSIRLHRDLDLEPLWDSEVFQRFLASRD